MGDGYNKDWGYSEFNDNRKKRPAYAASGWVGYGATEAGDEKTKGQKQIREGQKRTRMEGLRRDEVGGQTRRTDQLEAAEGKGAGRGTQRIRR